MTLTDHPDVLSVREVSSIFYIRPRTALEWRRTGRLPGVRVGRRWLFRRVDVERVLDLVRHADDAKKA